MKVIIDLIEEIREAIANEETFTFLAMLLKEDEKGDLVFAGEALINDCIIEDEKLQFIIRQEPQEVNVGTVLPLINGLPNEAMMYPVILKIGNTSHDVVGFGNALEDKKFVLFMQQ